MLISICMGQSAAAPVCMPALEVIWSVSRLRVSVLRSLTMRLA